MWGDASGMVQNVSKLILKTFWTIPDTSPPLFGLLSPKIHILAYMRFSKGTFGNTYLSELYAPNFEFFIIPGIWAFQGLLPTHMHHFWYKIDSPNYFYSRDTEDQIRLLDRGYGYNVQRIFF